MRRALNLLAAGASLAGIISLFTVPAVWAVEPIDDLQWLFIENTVALVTPPDAIIAEQARALMVQAGQERAAGRNGEMRRLLAQARVLLAGESWTASTEYAASLALEPDHVVADPARPLTLRVGQHFLAQPPQVTGLDISIGVRRWTRRPDPATALLPLGSFTTFGADLGDRSAATTLDISAVPDGSWELVADVRQNGVVLGRSITRLFVVRGLNRDLTTLAGAPSGLDPALAASIAYPVDLVRGLNEGVRQIRDVDMRALLDNALALLSSAVKGDNPLHHARGGLTRHYRSALTGRVEPYRLHVPTGWDGNKAQPLLILLHGSMGDENSMFAGGQVTRLAEQHGWIVASPFGYSSNSGWGGHIPVVLANGTMPAPRPSTIGGVVQPRDGVDPEPAEDDVLSVVQDIRAHYTVDARRIYIAGNSMGGEGAWHMGQRHPELWAAIAPGAGPLDPDSFPYARLKSVPVLAIHGRKDPITSHAATVAMVARLKAHGGKAALLEPDAGHDAFHHVLDDVMTWMAGQRRTVAAPAVSPFTP